MKRFDTRAWGNPGTREMEHYFSELVQEGHLSDAGEAWLITAVNGFRDMKERLAGFPDADGSSTVVSKIQLTYDITKPAGAVGNFDAHIFTMPFMAYTESTTLGSLNAEGSAYALPGPNIPCGDLGLINVVTTDAGNPLAFDGSASGAWGPPTNWTCTNIDGSALRNKLLGQRCRVIGLSFEVHDTTAKLNKQGTCLVYRLPNAAQSQGNLSAYNVSGGANFYQANAAFVHGAPSSPAEATLLAGTRQWEASKGCYVNANMSSQSNPMEYADNFGLIIDVAPQLATHDVQVCPNMVVQHAGGVNASIFGNCRAKHIPWNTSGAMFLGLANSATLHLIINVVVEQAPCFSDSALSVLATPSPALDDVALRLYAEISARMPAGVEVKENGLGTWFKRIIAIGKAVFPRVSPYIRSLPVVDEVLSAVGTAKQLVKDAKSIKDTVQKTIKSAKKTKKKGNKK